MISSLKLQPTPFRFLLYTEWIMLASCGMFAVAEYFENRQMPVHHTAILLSLGLMGLILPRRNYVHKWLYTIAEVSLIFYGATLGYLHLLPTLYLIVVIRSCFLFEAFECWMIAIVTLLLFSIHQIKYVQTVSIWTPPPEQHQFWSHLIAETFMFSLGLFLVLKLVNTLLAERQTKGQLVSAHEQLRHYAQQIEDLAAVRERNRIARDIHDSLGHALTAQNIQLRTAVRLWQQDTQRAKPFLEQAERLSAVAMQEVRQAVSTLRADAHEERPLEAAIASLANDFRQGTGIDVVTQIQLDAPVPWAIVRASYRIVQEALTNSCKYAEATEIKIQVSTTPESVYLLIADNGKGFNPNDTSSGFGLQGMQERIATFNGDFQLKTAPGAGCQITVQIPLQAVPSESVLPSRAAVQQSPASL
jgi:signal transduction histidine kinase